MSAPATPPKHVAHSVVALGSAAILAIYAAGYSRTRSAAEELEAAIRRRPVVPAPAPGPIAAPVVPAAPGPAPVESRIDAPLSAPSPAPVPRGGTEPAKRAPKLEASTPTAPVATDRAEAPSSTRPAAASTPELPPVASTAPMKAYKDGTYHGWGYSRHGDIDAFVVIEKGRIVRAGYDKCRTLWPCTLVDEMPPGVVRLQSADVDYVSGATDSSEAFYWGIVEALSKAAAAADTPAEPKPESSEPK